MLALQLLFPIYLPVHSITREVFNNNLSNMFLSVVVAEVQMQADVLAHSKFDVE